MQILGFKNFKYNSIETKKRCKKTGGRMGWSVQLCILDLILCILNFSWVSITFFASASNCLNFRAKNDAQLTSAKLRYFPNFRWYHSSVKANNLGLASHSKLTWDRRKSLPLRIEMNFSGTYIKNFTSYQKRSSSYLESCQHTTWHKWSNYI